MQLSRRTLWIAGMLVALAIVIVVLVVIYSGGGGGSGGGGAGGRIHFTAVFRYAEAAETALCRELGLLEGWADYPRRRVEADYLRVLRFEDEVEVRIVPERLGRTSITWRWEIARDG